jgi:hypothetical protein
MGVCVALMAFLAQAGDGPVRDKTGMRWELPFPKALERAKAESRLLMIKPIAFGTSKDGGW